MTGNSLPVNTHIQHIHLQVSNLDNTLTFYRDLLGFKPIERAGNTLSLSADGTDPAQILITQRPGAIPKPARTTGLYHVAIRLPDRIALARLFNHLIEHDWQFQGFSDHTVSEALYLADPEGNGLEIYVDRPRQEWSVQNGQVEMKTDPLDIKGLLEQARRDQSPWTGIHPGTDIGHVHLHVADLRKAEAFYHELLGFDVTQRSYPGALFISAGGYHHHIGLNVWAGQGAPPPPEHAIGLLSYAIHIPKGEAFTDLIKRIHEAGEKFIMWKDYPKGVSVMLRDPSVNQVELFVRRDQIEAGILEDLKRLG
jgi:catechol 2,3-dioxygenase